MWIPADAMYEMKRFSIKVVSVIQDSPRCQPDILDDGRPAGALGTIAENPDPEFLLECGL